jgi:AcrR family transcriptional regulator
MGAMSERRDEIVELAGQLFARKGFAGTTVREIADRAGILSGSLYHHFDSKEAIAAEILLQYYEQLAERFNEIVAASTSSIETINAFITEAFKDIDLFPAAVALIQHSRVELFALPRFKEVVERAEQVQRIWITNLRAAVKDGYFRSDTDPRLVYVFIRDALSAVSRWWRPEGRYSIEEIADRYRAMVLFGLRDKLETASSARA